MNAKGKDPSRLARQHLLFSHHHLSELGKLVAGLDVPYLPYVM